MENEPNFSIPGLEHLEENFKLQEWLSQLPKTKKLLAIAIYEEEDTTYIEGYNSAEMSFQDSIWAMELFKHQLLSGDE